MSALSRQEARIWSSHGSSFTVALVVLGLAAFLLALASSSERTTRSSRTLLIIGAAGTGLGVVLALLPLPALLGGTDVPRGVAAQRFGDELASQQVRLVRGDRRAERRDRLLRRRAGAGGPTGDFSSDLQFGLVLQNPISFAGPSERPDVNALSIQPTLTYNFEGGGFAGLSDFSLSFDWTDGGAATIPVGVQVGKAVSLGKRHFVLSAEGGKPVSRASDMEPEWLIGLEAASVINVHPAAFR